MWDLVILIRLIPYVFGFLVEQWIRLYSRKWTTVQATVTADTAEGQSQPYIAILQYQYTVGGNVFDGCFLRRCLRKSSVEEAIAQYPRGSPISIRYNPHKPGRSYAPLPLGWGGFLFAGPLVFGFLALILFVAYAGFENRYIEAHYAIPESEWHAIEIPRLFRVTMPDTPSRSLGYHSEWQLDEKKPQTMQWTVIRTNSYFYVEILRFPLGTDLSHDGLDQVLAALKAEDSKRYVYGDKSISLEGRSGREFQYTRPYNTMRAYVDGRDIYILGTDGYVDTDMKKFFDSFHFTSDMHE